MFPISMVISLLEMTGKFTFPTLTPLFAKLVSWLVSACQGISRSMSLRQLETTQWSVLVFPDLNLSVENYFIWGLREVFIGVTDDCHSFYTCTVSKIRLREHSCCSRHVSGWKSACPPGCLATLVDLAQALLVNGIVQRSECDWLTFQLICKIRPEWIYFPRSEDLLAFTIRVGTFDVVLETDIIGVVYLHVTRLPWVLPWSASPLLASKDCPRLNISSPLLVLGLWTGYFAFLNGSYLHWAGINIRVRVCIRFSWCRLACIPSSQIGLYTLSAMGVHSLNVSAWDFRTSTRMLYSGLQWTCLSFRHWSFPKWCVWYFESLPDVANLTYFVAVFADDPLHA